MPGIAGAFKRVLVGRPVRTDRLATATLPKRLALPVFSSDAWSSVAYAPDEILLTLSLAGLAALTLSPWVGLAVVVVMMTVVFSYRQTVRAYPSGGGDYEVATVNLGPRAGVTVASALLVDYALTVAVSISSASQYLAATVPATEEHRTVIAVGTIALLAVLNLRGIRESGRAVAIPGYLFMGAIGLLACAGFVRELTGTLEPAASASLEVAPAASFDEGLVGVAGVFLVLRAFSSGAAALTGVEAINNGVPAFKKPRARNAATTLALLGIIGAAMLMSMLHLARATGVRFVEDPATQLLRNGEPVGEDYRQDPVVGQIAASVFDGVPALYILVTVATGLVLVLAANTAFNGFPSLGSVLARDGFLPRQLHTRGDRLAFSNGILALAVAAGVLVFAFDAEVTLLIQLYIVGVFTSFTLSQLGMVKHWTRKLRVEAQPGARSRMRRSRLVNAFGCGMTASVLIVVLITKFTHGAWLTLVLLAVLYVIMNGVRRHYNGVARKLAVPDINAAKALPARVHGIVLISRLHQPSMRALAYARATRPSSLEAVTVNVDADDTARLREAWDEAEIPVPLTVLDSPFREVTRPVVDYVRSIRHASPRDLVVVFVPEYVVSRWWEQLLHNQSALRLKGRLLFTPGVVMASVPYQLDNVDDLEQPPAGQP
ncbi:APC family permease [Georgenia halophila]|uniref:APC family permease n=1 Tax=Georgenia halophila TaxID=620889 RepID=A0ABP8LNT7_9MICO